MTIKNILFLNGWEGRGAVRVKAEIIDDDGRPRDVVIEKDEVARILTAALNAGARLTLAAGQKLYRIEAEGVPEDPELTAREARAQRIADGLEDANITI